MECIKCGSAANLNMYPLRWNAEGNAIGFVLVCDSCQDEGDLKITWRLGDDKADTEKAPD